MDLLQTSIHRRSLREWPWWTAICWDWNGDDGGWTTDGDAVRYHALVYLLDFRFDHGTIVLLCKVAVLLLLKFVARGRRHTSISALRRYYNDYWGQVPCWGQPTWSSWQGTLVLGVLGLFWTLWTEEGQNRPGHVMCRCHHSRVSRVGFRVPTF